MPKLVTVWKTRARRWIPLLVLAGLSRSAVQVAALPLAAPPAEPVWPSPVLVAEIRDLLTQYYDQEALAGGPISALAPRTEAEKASSAKDPDTLWEQAVSEAACHAATSRAGFESCAGKRLAATFGACPSGHVSHHQRSGRRKTPAASADARRRRGPEAA